MCYLFCLYDFFNRCSVAEAVDFAIEGYKVLSKLDDLAMHNLFSLLLSE